MWGACRAENRRAVQVAAAWRSYTNSRLHPGLAKAADNGINFTATHSCTPAHLVGDVQVDVGGGVLEVLGLALLLLVQELDVLNACSRQHSGAATSEEQVSPPVAQQDVSRACPAAQQDVGWACVRVERERESGGAAPSCVRARMYAIRGASAATSVAHDASQWCDRSPVEGLVNT